MRRLPFASRLVCLLCLPMLPLASSAASAEEDRPFQFGLESRFSEPSEFENSEVSWGLIPNFSYHLNDRFRLDAFAGVAHSDEAGLYLSLQPGFRYYLGRPHERFRFNTGLSVGFTVIDQDVPATTEGLDGSTVPVFRNDDVWLRAVPIEVEYWGTKRWGLTMALDYQTRFDRDPLLEDNEGFGLAAGFRFKIR